MRKESTDKALEAYNKALSIAASALSPAEPMKLTVVLKVSQFYDEILKSNERACEVAKPAFDAAMMEMNANLETSYNESTRIMITLRYALAQWSSEQDWLDEDEDEEPEEYTRGYRTA